MEYGTLNFNWADEQMADIAKKYAENPGQQDGVGGVITQIPIAMAFGEMLKEGVVGGMKSPFSQQSQAFTNNQTPKEDPVEEETNTNENTNPVPDDNENTEKKKFCTNCGAQVNPNAKFCNQCGVKIFKELKCPKCGVKVKEEFKFCENCGEPLNN